jgi:uncharacterized protein YdaU (DUF1376 family)
MAMSMHHRGIYIQLLAASWDQDEPGTLPLPIEIAARSARLDPRSLRDFMAKSPRCFVEVGSKLVNRKLQKQWKDFQEYQEKQRVAANVRWHGKGTGSMQPHMQPQSSAFASASASASKDIKPGFGFATGHTRKIIEATRESHVGEGPSDSSNLGGFVMHECPACHFRGTKSAVARGCGKHKPGGTP